MDLLVKNLLLIGVLVVAGGLGIVLENRPELGPLGLVLCLHVVTLLTMLAVAGTALRKKPPDFRFRMFIALQILAFRIGYFPVVVLAGTAACVSEWMFASIAANLPIKIFPAFFIAQSLMFAAISGLLARAVEFKKPAIVLAILLGLPATLISFSDQADLNCFRIPSRF